MQILQHMRFLSNKFATVWLFGLAAAACIWTFTIFSETGFAPLNTLVFDTYQRQKPRVWGNSDVTIVDLDESSIKRFGQWPWPRSVIAKLTDRLGELGAATIVFDIVFSEPDRTSPLRAIEDLKKAGAQVSLPNKVDMLDNDVIFAEAIARNRVVAGLVLSRNGPDAPPEPKAGTGLVGTAPAHLMSFGWKAIRNLAILDDAATGIGDFTFEPEAQSDAVVRKTVLMRGANGFNYPSLAMETLRVVQGAGGFKIKYTDASGELDTGKRAVVSTQVGALEIPTDANGAINIYHSPLEDKPTLSAQSVLLPLENGTNDTALAKEISNHIILIGTSAAGLLDLRATPLQPVVPGVTIHAEILDQIISGNYLTRPDIAPGIELSVAIVAVLILLASLPRMNSLGVGVVAVLLIILVIGGFWYAFSQNGLLLTPVVPVLSILVAGAVGMAAHLLITERHGRYVRNAFGHYLSPTMVERLAENPEALTLGGEEKDLTLLFCDIRGFTSLSEGLDPTELTDLLNNFLTPMTTALLERGATIDKYMGDAIMAFWNAPIDQDDHAQRACEGLLDMQAALMTLNATSKHPIHVGIGLNSGPCCVGNLGSTQRFNYSAIGDAVNVASRIEGLTKQYGLSNLVAEETLDASTGFSTLEIDRVSVVGREQPLTVHTIMGRSDALGGSAFGELREAHERMLDAYRAGDVESGLVAMVEAGRLSEQISGQSLMKVYAIYGERFAVFRETGVPKKWDGVYRATSK